VTHQGTLSVEMYGGEKKRHCCCSEGKKKRVKWKKASS